MSKSSAVPPKSPDDIVGLSFEAACKELEAIVRTLEGGTGDLDKSINDYERGNALKEHCLKLLGEAKLKVEQIQKRADGTLATKAFSEE